MSFAKALSPAIRELRFLCCQTGQGSLGTRQFVQSMYPIVKKHNPNLPILIRESNGTPARVFARFERGLEKHAELDGLSAKEVEQRVTELVNTKQ